MKFYKNILLLASLLVANAHYVKRDFTKKKYEIYKNAVPTSYEQIVKDANNPNRVMKLKKFEVDATEDLFKINKGKYSKSIINDPFNLNVHCYSTEDCENYPARIQEGAYFIAQTFEFYQTVNVNVTIFPFCRYMQNESGCESVMGITYPPTFISLSETKDSEPFLYPQALVKQLDVDSDISYDPIDFLIYLNSSYKPIESQDNRALIAAHEILHGLGFFHQINPISVYLNNYQNYFNNDFALPPIRYEETENTIAYNGWTPFSIFDKYIVNSSKPDEYLYGKLEKYKTHEVNFEISIKRPTTQQYNKFMSTFKALENDVEANAGGIEVANLFSTLNAVGFRTKDGKVVELQTFDGRYESASSISHINVPFKCKSSSTCTVTNASINENYLMYFTVISKASTSRLVNAFKESKHELVGSDIVRIMCTLGWNEKGSSSDNNNYSNNVYSFSQENNNSSGSRHLATPSFIIMILSFIFFIFRY
ncbi:hypothetical protein BCR36DRAFT_338006 [Piromyces finnis]|uniref:Uncharacterized protein n=1 Tax=Piromyces finnis TaxID=1754191 RepID=A0A1Y1UY24_9FUNG|nr:hypothetical protein BCR36DRAFT_338006 [Piromyces finnis]|eukprot:ORX42151.1 hypothetical protein BCR36DRAFT_338006 [Piromyces finnis]